VSLTKIDPDEIPEVTNKFLMRADSSKDSDSKKKDASDRKHARERRSSKDRGRNGERERKTDFRNSFGWSKRRVPMSRSGRAIKGRGIFRYRTPSRSRSRTKSQTPPHWKQAQKRTIKFSELEKIEQEKKDREREIERRVAERKKRHEDLAKESKKSFYELSHSTTYDDKCKDSVEREMEKKQCEEEEECLKERFKKTE